jgi:hypothetical protein
MKLALISGCLLAASQALFPQAPATSSIEGQVVNQITGAPIPRVALSLRLNSPQRATRPGEPPRNVNATIDAESDAQGRFAFRNLEAGAYQLTAQRQGFVSPGARNGGFAVSSLSSQLFLGEAQQLTGYLVRLTPQSVIAGKVVDADGDPVAGCQIRALRWGYSNGVRQLTPFPIPGTTTNDLGEYRLAGMPAGSYYVEASPARNQNRTPVFPPQPLPDQPQLIYTTTYHPSATESSAAASVRVAAGVEVTGIDIKLVKTIAFTIRGRLVDPDAPPGRPGFAQLRPRNNLAGTFMGFSTSSSMDGTFVISGVPPGSYELVAQRANTGNSLGGLVGPAAIAILPIEVRDRNLDGISVTLLPSFDVQGVVKFAQAAQCGGFGMTVSLLPASGVSYGGYAPPAQVGADFKFTLKNVGSSTYSINVTNPGSCYVQSIRYGGKEVADSGLSMDGTGSLEITLAASNATLRGSVVDAAGKAPPRAYVTALRKGSPPSSYRQAFATTGSFAFPNLPPGTYDVFAWEQLDVNAMRSAEFLKQFESRCKSVTVDENGSSALQLTIIPASETAETDTPVPAEPPRAKGSLEGRVVETGSNAPLKNASVVLRNMSGPAMTSNGLRESVAEADAQGHFAFTDLEPGSYTIQARRQGFGEGGPAGAASMIGESLIVGEGQRIANYVLRMSPRSVISGKIVDESGDPVSRVRVAVYRYAYSQGQRRLLPAGPVAQTDDLGQYRIANLAPGTYYVSATRGNDPLFPNMLVTTRGDLPMLEIQGSGSPLRTVEIPPAPVAGEVEMGYPPVWYPNAPGLEAASAVTVKVGAENSSIDFTLRKIPVWSIRGQIVDPAADPARPPMITLSPKGSPLVMPTGRASAQARDGSFEISGVPPGSYVLMARVMAGQQTRMAVRTIEVKDASVDGVRLEITSGRALKGSLKVEGGGTFPASFMSFTSPEGGVARVMSPASDGNLNIQNVFPVVYSMELMGGNGGPYASYYVKSVRYGGREFSPWAIDLSGDGQLDIVLSAKAATLEGSVVDRQGKPAANAAIVIAPATAGEPLRTGTADASGNFYFAGLRPGDYRVFAWDAAAPEASDAPASLAPFEASSKAVTLAESAREKIQVTTIAPK